ncbi:serine/threonine protein kinase [Kitasatospora sp. NPDC051853]|uniref:serine/threonine protein kinase n=1 Tax=Kitasatospora sp. NPDC051853 TaxID=3364058 RepID=UPI0037AF8344
MASVLVHVPEQRGRSPLTVELTPGQTARFGRGAPGCPVDIELDDPAVPRLAGELRATEDYWQLSNLSTGRSYLVENPEGAGEYFRVAPRRLRAPVPFEFARVVLPTRTGPLAFQVFAPAHAYLEGGADAVLDGAATLTPFSLDESAVYFLVLVALCEARLRDESTAAIPTARQVAERLHGHPSAGQLSEQAVSFHLDYLARHKLRIKQPGDSGRRLDWRREGLVNAALRFGLVHEAHLPLLTAGPGQACTDPTVTSPAVTGPAVTGPAVTGPTGPGPAGTDRSTA